MLDGIRDTYDAEVMAIDAALGRMMAALAERGIDQEALVVITADHGEELDDHGSFGHGRTLFEEAIHVPLILRTPRQKRGRVIDPLVSSVDVAPTLLEVIGLERPDSFEGVSLARYLESPQKGTSLRRFVTRLWDARRKPAVFSERHPQTPSDAPSHRVAVVRERSKVIVWSDGRQDFFSLASDPHEQHADGVSPKERKTLVTTLGKLRQRVMRNRTAAEKRTIDPRTRDALRALGYTD
jgi:arylsulfatase A-like enzyme